MTAPDADPSAGNVDEDQAVLLYLQAVEAARTAPDGFPDPEGAGPALAGAEMVAGDDSEDLGVQLAEATPGSRAHVLALEDDFVRAAAGYSRRHGMTYDGWLRSGVDAKVLARAGITRSAE